MSTASAPSAAGTTTWNIDNSHTLAEFSVRHLMISTVKGRFGEVSGKVVADDADPARAQIEATINVASIDTREAQRDAHLRSADFFDAENFPTLTFRSTRIEKASGDELKVTGDLTIRGTTREVALDVTPEGRVKDPWGGERARLQRQGQDQAQRLRPDLEHGARNRRRRGRRRHQDRDRSRTREAGVTR